MRTQVVIVGAGPAGMLLAHLLRATGIDSIVLECRSRSYVEGRVRAGVLEQGTVDLLAGLGLASRLKREGLVHGGVKLSVDGSLFRVDLAELAGAAITIYGQQELMKDLFDAAPDRDIEVRFEVESVRLHAIETDRPSVTFHHDGADQRLDCDFIAGCDGSHGICHAAIPSAVRQTFERHYPFGWLGILADVPPANDELIYCNHARGFALASMRSPSRSRFYVQCSLDDKLEDWPDERVWDELALRLGPEAAAGVVRGPAFERSIAPLRSFVQEPMRFGRLFLAGDAAHIVPPTGAKGLNLAASDVLMLSDALANYYRTGSQSGLDGYSERALVRVWKAERFSWWFTGLTHHFPNMDRFGRKIQLAELAYLEGSRAAQITLAENYVGLPLSLS